MMFTHVLQLHPAYPLLAIGISLITVGLYNRYFHGLNKIPGPVLASYTDLWRLYHTWNRRPELLHIQLHEKHGPLVRIGPRAVSVSEPDAATVIYALKSGFIKSDFYVVQQTLAKDRRLFTLFTSTDERFHAKLRRAVSHAYAMSTLVQFEHGMRLMSSESLRSPSVSASWTAVKMLRASTQAAVVGQMPFLDNIMLKNPVRIALSRLGLLNANTFMVDFPGRRPAERIDTGTGTFKKTAEMDSYVWNDFLSRLILVYKKDPEFITMERVLALITANVFTGSDTTAISLRAFFYYLLKPQQHCTN